MTEHSTSQIENSIRCEGSVFKTEDIKRHGNVYELRFDSRALYSDVGPSFERKCLNEIASSQKDSVIFGTLLVDYLLSHYAKTKALARPDAMKFKMEDQRIWSLEEIFEFKAGKRNGLREVERKVVGFSETLSFFRENPNELPALIRENLSGVLRAPNAVNIPQNKDLMVTFVYSNREVLPSFSRQGLPIRAIRIRK